MLPVKRTPRNTITFTSAARKFPWLSARSMLALALLIFLLAGYWALPIHGQVVILAGQNYKQTSVWPQVWLEPVLARPGDQVSLYVRDNTPWTYVKLLVDGAEAQRDESYSAGNGPWTWRWQFVAPEAPMYQAIFYHDCQAGCAERVRLTLGDQSARSATAGTVAPTKLGVMFADPQRNWHGRAGWTVELTYAQRQEDDADFSIDGLARRVWQAHRAGLRVLVRIAYDRRQALPPAGDEVALAHFLTYCGRLARDQRLEGVYGYIIGAAYNTSGENMLAPDRPTTPKWYARVFNGYGLAPSRADNVVQTMRSVNPRVRVLVGPVAPWSADQNGALTDTHNQPWLNYMNTLVAHIDEATRARQEHGVPLAGPDGFALRAAGRVDAPEIAAQPHLEPVTDLHRSEWGDAQAGFRVYRDWLAIINRYPTTRGLPAYITSTNVVTGDPQTPPAQSYPPGWLTTALGAIDREPQVQALCWFVDQPLGGLWDNFSLNQHPGKLHDTAEEFDRLLQR